jgi:Protein of unknown function (DUF4231)
MTAGTVHSDSGGAKPTSEEVKPVEPDRALEYARNTLQGIKDKAERNKHWSDALFFIIIAATASSPILILLPLAPIWSRNAPAILTALASVASAWVQLRKPQERWALYRTAQREIEFEIDQYTFGLGKYRDLTTRVSVLADAVSNRALQLHYEWLPMVPRLRELQPVPDEARLERQSK